MEPFVGALIPLSREKAVLTWDAGSKTMDSLISWQTMNDLSAEGLFPIVKGYYTRLAVSLASSIQSLRNGQAWILMQSSICFWQLRMILCDKD